jgi:hypothetical protein
VAKSQENRAPARSQLSRLLKFSVRLGEVVVLQRNLSPRVNSSRLQSELRLSRAWIAVALRGVKNHAI